MTAEETLKELDVKKVQPGQWTTITAADTAAENSGDFTLTITTDSTNDFRFDNVKVTSEGENAIMAEAAGGGLKDEFANYTDGTRDYCRYFSQKCEADAREYADEATYEYYTRITEYLNSRRNPASVKIVKTNDY